MNVDDISGLFFLDTNILVYTFDDRTPRKRATAHEWVRGGLASGRGVIGTQVAQEFLNVATGKFQTPLSQSDTREYIDVVLKPLCRHYPTLESFKQALKIKAETGYSWYDSLIIAAAIEAQCSWLITEDLQDGHKIGSLTIRNPFL